MRAYQAYVPGATLAGKRTSHAPNGSSVRTRGAADHRALTRLSTDNSFVDSRGGCKARPRELCDERSSILQRLQHREGGGV
jgi:hypothetical protein